MPPFRRLRLFFLVLEVRIWLVNACASLYFAGAGLSETLGSAPVGFDLGHAPYLL